MEVTGSFVGEQARGAVICPGGREKSNRID